MSRKLVDGQNPIVPHDADKGGRPSKLELDPKLIDSISQAIRLGSYFEVAAALNGIGYSTLRLWVNKGLEQPDTLYGAFVEQMNKAVAEAEIRDVSTIDAFAFGREAQYEKEPLRDSDGTIFKNPDGSPMMVIAKDGEGKPILKRAEIRPQWQAAAWKLERRAPSRWGRKFDVHVRPGNLLEQQRDSAPEKDMPISTEEYDKIEREVRELIQDENELSDADDC